MNSVRPADGIDQRTLDLIVELVVEALQTRLEEIVADLATETAGAHAGCQLTVEDVAARFHVARSTVYAHWREWGGYKLGEGDKAPIRFDGGSLPIVKPGPTPRQPAKIEVRPKRRGKKRPRRELLVDAPRLAQPLDRSA
jgi:hypothetical protein